MENSDKNPEAPTRFLDDPESPGKNADRSDWAGVALHAFRQETHQQAGEEPDYEVIADLLCDLRHYCDRQGVNFAYCLRVGNYHYEAETGESVETWEEEQAREHLHNLEHFAGQVVAYFADLGDRESPMYTDAVELTGEPEEERP